MKTFLVVLTCAVVAAFSIGIAQVALAEGPACYTCRATYELPTSPTEWECVFPKDGETGEGIFCDNFTRYSYCDFSGGACLYTVVNGGSGGVGGGIGGGGGGRCNIPIGGTCPAECMTCTTYYF